MPYLKVVGDINIGCIDNENKEYNFFLIKDINAGKIGIVFIWCKNPIYFIEGLGSSNYIEPKEEKTILSPIGRKFIGTWTSNKLKYIFTDEKVLRLVSNNDISDFTYTINNRFTPHHLDMRLEGEYRPFKCIFRFLSDDVLELAMDCDLQRNVRPSNFSTCTSKLYRGSQFEDEIVTTYILSDEILKNELYQNFKSAGIIDIKVNGAVVVLYIDEKLYQGFLIDKVSTMTIMSSISDKVKQVTKRNFALIDVYYLSTKVLSSETKIWDTGINLRYY